MSISRALYICARTNFGLSRIYHFDWFESYVTRVWSWFHFNTIRANSEPQAGDLSTWKTHLHAIDSCYRKYLCQTWCSSWKWKKIAISSKYAIQRRLADQGDRYRLENERFAGSLCINANCRVFSWYLWLTMLSNTQTPKHPNTQAFPIQDAYDDKSLGRNMERPKSVLLNLSRLCRRSRY